MTTLLEVFDPAMCCSSGVCGTDVDPVLPRFAADLDWLKRSGVKVQRHNLAQEPMAFANNPQVRDIVAATHSKELPIIVVNGEVVSKGVYPTREELSQWTGVKTGDKPIALTTLSNSASCCDDGECC